MTNRDKIAIVGGGLSAIYSYFGAREAGYGPYEIDVMVLGRSFRLGAIFMYTSPIPWKTVKVSSSLWGSCIGYAFKQWRDADVMTSAHRRFRNGMEPEVVEDLYDPENLYQTLWSRVPQIKKINPLTEEDLKTLRERYKAVICTFPEETTKRDYQKYILKIPVTFQRTQFSCPAYTVIYNGLLEIPWVRKTFMPGRIFTEYPHSLSEWEIREFEEMRDPDPSADVVRIEDLRPFTPALSWNQRIQDNQIRVGRQATFDTHYLSHQAQTDTRKFLEEL